MSRRLRLFLWLVDLGAPLAVAVLRTDKIGAVRPTRLGWVVARVLGLGRERIRWDVQP